MLALLASIASIATEGENKSRTYEHVAVIVAGARRGEFLPKLGRFWKIAKAASSPSFGIAGNLTNW